MQRMRCLEAGNGSEKITRLQFVRKFIRYEENIDAWRRSGRVQMMDPYAEESAPPAFASVVAPKVCDMQLELDLSHRRTLQTAADAAAVPLTQLRSLLADILPEWSNAAIDNVFFSAVQPRKAGAGVPVVDYKQALLPHAQPDEGVESAAVVRTRGLGTSSGLAPAAMVRLSPADREMVRECVANICIR